MNKLVDTSSGTAPLKLAVVADAANLPGLTGSLRAAWAAAGLPESTVHTFELALEEYFMNVVMHGSAGGVVRHVGMALSVANGEVTLILEDNGPAFDPLSLPPPDVTAGIDERRVGGYGVYLVRQMMDAVSYQRIGTHNQLRMSQRLER